MSLELDTSIGITPIVAWRAWDVIWPYYLTDLNRDGIWIPGQRNEAKCRLDNNHAAPVADCTCGFWAMKELTGSARTGRVIGEVYLWGRVLDCEYGYRAEYAYPKSLYYHGAVADERFKEFAMLLSGVYGVKLQEMPQEIYDQVQYHDYGNSFSVSTTKPKPPTVEELAAIATTEGVETEVRKYARSVAMQRLYMSNTLLTKTVTNLKTTLAEKEAKLHKQTLLRQFLKDLKLS